MPSIYIVKVGGDSGALKIGTTKNKAKYRLNGIKQVFGHKPELLNDFIFPNNTDMYALEGHIHGLLSEYKRKVMNSRETYNADCYKNAVAIISAICNNENQVDDRGNKISTCRMFKTKPSDIITIPLQIPRRYYDFFLRLYGGKKAAGFKMGIIIMKDLIERGRVKPSKADCKRCGIKKQTKGKQ